MNEQVQQLQQVRQVRRQAAASARLAEDGLAHARVPHLMGLRTAPGHDSRGDRRKVRLTRLTALAR
jgi:hypothetical protein